MKILLIEDDTYTTSKLQEYLLKLKFSVDTSDNGQTGLEMAELFEYDLILLDLVIPRLSGIEVCQQLRHRGNYTPILMLTAKDSIADCVKCLDAGADDYLTKPFAWSELLARLHALMRRPQNQSPQTFTWGELCLDIEKHKVTYQGKDLDLTAKEYGLLEVFLRNPQRIFSRQGLIDRVWSIAKMPGEEAVTFQIKGLRRKLSQAGIATEVIETVYGFGYRLKAEPARQEEEKITVTNNLTSLKLAEQKLNLVIEQLWEKFREEFLQEIDWLTQVCKHLDQGILPTSERKKATATAHRLIGALGSYGRIQEAEIARKIEGLLENNHKINSERLLQLLSYLKQSLLPEESDLSSNTNSKINCLLLVGVESNLAGEITAIASQQNWRVTITSNLEDARIFLQRNLPQAILLDLDQSGTSEAGWQFLQELSAEHPHFPFFVISTENSLQYRIKVARLGGKAFYPKSIKVNRLFKTIVDTIEQSQNINATILVVDDDRRILRLLDSILKPWGFKVVTLSDYQQFWQVLQTTQPDLLILDIEMPNVSGLELCQVVRNDDRFGTLPILFLSVHNDAETVRQVFTAGADDYVAKPIIPAELVTRVLNRLNRVKSRNISRRLI